MPPIVKQSVPHILISMFVAPVMLAIFAWAGNSILDNKETTILLPTIETKLDKIDSKQDEMLRYVHNSKLEIMTLVYKNTQEIALLKAMVKKQDEK